MEQEFVNLYIEKLQQELADTQKERVVLKTQVAWQEKIIQNMTELQNKLQEANNELNAKIKMLSGKKSKKNDVVIEGDQDGGAF